MATFIPAASLKLLHIDMNFVPTGEVSGLAEYLQL
jgi:hypothetical protein